VTGDRVRASAIALDIDLAARVVELIEDSCFPEQSRGFPDGDGCDQRRPLSSSWTETLREAFLVKESRSKRQRHFHALERRNLVQRQAPCLSRTECVPSTPRRGERRSVELRSHLATSDSYCGRSGA